MKSRVGLLRACIFLILLLSSMCTNGESIYPCMNPYLTLAEIKTSENNPNFEFKPISRKNMINGISVKYRLFLIPNFYRNSYLSYFYKNIFDNHIISSANEGQVFNVDDNYIESVLVGNSKNLIGQSKYNLLNNHVLIILPTDCINMITPSPGINPPEPEPEDE